MQSAKWGVNYAFDFKRRLSATETRLKFSIHKSARDDSMAEFQINLLNMHIIDINMLNKFLVLPLNICDTPVK